MSHQLRPSACLFALILTAGCSSTPALEPHPLPYHIVVVPMEPPTVGAVTPGELPGDETELRLDITTEELTAALGSALDEYCFTRVTVLDQAEADVTAFEAQSELLERARAAGADLLVEFGLRFDAEVYRENAGTFWLNWPLFFFAGPSAWFIPDNGYFADVELTTAVYDLNALTAGSLDLGDAAARVLLTTSRYTGAEIKFTDRADGVGGLALGILVPSGYLSRQTESVEVEVEQRILDELRYQVVQTIQARRGDLVAAEWIAPVYVEPERVRLERDGDEVVVRGDVRLRRGGLAQEVEALELAAGAETVRVQPALAATDGEAGDLTAPFEARVPVAADARTLRVECLAGGRDRFVRSYTFDLPGAEPEDAE